MKSTVSPHKLLGFFSKSVPIPDELFPHYNPSYLVIEVIPCQITILEKKIFTSSGHGECPDVVRVGGGHPVQVGT